jgi:hypothetical protein
VQAPLHTLRLLHELCGLLLTPPPAEPPSASSCHMDGAVLVRLLGLDPTRPVMVRALAIPNRAIAEDTRVLEAVIAAGDAHEVLARGESFASRRIILGRNLLLGFDTTTARGERDESKSKRKQATTQHEASWDCG